MNKTTLCSAFVFATCLLCAQGVTSRQLLDLTATVDSILKDVVCAADKIDAVLAQFAGLDSPELGGLPTVLAAVETLDSEIETKIEKALGIAPPASCSKVPQAPTLDDILKTIYCGLSDIDSGLQQAITDLDPTDPLVELLNKLLTEESTIEGDLVQFLTGITCP